MIFHHIFLDLVVVCGKICAKIKHCWMEREKIGVVEDIDPIPPENDTLPPV